MTLSLTPVTSGELTLVQNSSPAENIDNESVPASGSHNDNLLSPIDLWWDDTHRRLHLRTLMVTENGDTPEIAIRRSEGDYPNGDPEAITSGVALGLIHFTGWTSGGSFQSRSAQIYARAAEDITDSAAGGHLIFATTPNGTASGTVDRMTIRQDGAVGIVSGNLTIEQVDSLGARGDLVAGGNVKATGRVTAKIGADGSQSSTEVLLGDVGPSSQAAVRFAGDTNIYRYANGVVKTDGKMLAGTGIGVGNSASGSTLGTVTKKIEVFDATGASLGFIPVYDAIT